MSGIEFSAISLVNKENHLKNVTFLPLGLCYMLMTQTNLRMKIAAFASLSELRKMVSLPSIKKSINDWHLFSLISVYWLAIMNFRNIN